jgi:ferric-dicitrate binding protein FerR (iron transport regulator)
VLAVGEWLEPTAPTELVVADIGTMEVDPGSKLRLLATSSSGHRLELAEGRIRARVTAPPRLLVVETPSASAVDLGCAYDLTVLPDGSSLLLVQRGEVSLEAPVASRTCRRTRRR